MSKHARGAMAHARRAIAAQAARLIAEDGLADYGAAKRKAARQLGFRESDGLPDNAEVEEAVRAYQSLYQNQEQRERLGDLRRVGLDVMRRFADHRPYLAGAVWNGTATRGAPVDIDLFTDEAKRVEMLLLNEGIPYRTAERAHFVRGIDARVPVLVFERDDCEIRVSLFAEADERNALKPDAHGQRERGRTDDVESLIHSADEEADVERFLAAIR
jgi:hypothetical protein